MPILLPTVAERLNSSCFCITLDRERLSAAMDRESRDPASRPATAAPGSIYSRTSLSSTGA